jgi:predicted metal-dependent phosphoesterase TrpH
LKMQSRYAKANGCKTSIAHPGQYGFKEPILKIFKDLGVDAIEAYHPRHTPDDTRYYLELARRLNFQVSGGSDFHTNETDLVGSTPSLGRTQYPLEAAKKFLGDLI